MNPNHVTLVQDSWRQIAPSADQAAEGFYQRLFEIDPGLRPLFGKTHMATQREKLIRALTVAVDSLDRPPVIMPLLQDLGRRHRGYGVTAAHYQSVGAALIATLEEGLGSAWTGETAAAWQAAYGLVAETMQNGDGQPAPSA